MLIRSYTSTYTRKHTYKSMVIFAIVDFNSKPLAPVSPEKNKQENNEVNENDIKTFLCLWF